MVLDKLRKYTAIICHGLGIKLSQTRQTLVQPLPSFGEYNSLDCGTVTRFGPKVGQIGPKMGQIREIFRSVSVHFGAPRQNVLKLILKSP